MKTAIFMAAMTVVAHGAPATTDHVGAVVRGISAAAKGVNHVVLVNVGEAVEPTVFSEAATYALSKINVNVWTNAADVSVCGRLVCDPALLQKTFGSKARVGVFLERSGDAPRFLAVPGVWCRVNMDGLDVGDPDAQTFKDRVAKMMLKGIAYAAGCGASLDASCSMYYGGSTMEGLDMVGIRLSPGAYFPMLEMLRRAGGDDIVTRQQ